MESENSAPGGEATGPFLLSDGPRPVALSLRWSYHPDSSVDALRTGRLKGPSGLDLYVTSAFRSEYNPQSGHFTMSFDRYTGVNVEMTPVWVSGDKVVKEGEFVGNEAQKVKIVTGLDMCMTYLVAYGSEYHEAIVAMRNHLSS